VCAALTVFRRLANDGGVEPQAEHAFDGIYHRADAIYLILDGEKFQA
jgi:hypothetical protein